MGAKTTDCNTPLPRSGGSEQAKLSRRLNSYVVNRILADIGRPSEETLDMLYKRIYGSFGGWCSDSKWCCPKLTPECLTPAAQSPISMLGDFNRLPITHEINAAC
jgi:hypothetical protein